MIIIIIIGNGLLLLLDDKKKSYTLRLVRAPIHNYGGTTKMTTGVTTLKSNLQLLRHRGLG